MSAFFLFFVMTGTDVMGEKSMRFPWRSEQNDAPSRFRSDSVTPDKSCQTIQDDTITGQSPVKPRYFLIPPLLPHSALGREISLLLTKKADILNFFYINQIHSAFLNERGNLGNEKMKGNVGV